MFKESWILSNAKHNYVCTYVIFIIYWENDRIYIVMFISHINRIDLINDGNTRVGNLYITRIQ